MRRARVGLVVGVTLALLSEDCAPGSGGDIMESKPAGSVRLTSAVGGPMILSPSRCTAGDRERFLGADFHDEKPGLVLRLAVDPMEGPAVRVFSSETASGTSAVFRRSECRVFNWSVDATNMRVNRIQDYRIFLELDCAAKDGSSIEGKLSAAHCH